MDDEFALPPPADDASDVDSRAVSDVDDDDDASPGRPGSGSEDESEGEDLMENMEG